jgi:hypothetical protein
MALLLAQLELIKSTVTQPDHRETVDGHTRSRKEKFSAVQVMHHAGVEVLLAVHTCGWLLHLTEPV